jgi:abortive infection bacteriophage resistance protein
MVCSKTNEVLAQKDLSRLEENVENFKNKLFSIEKSPMTSKTHWLLCHVYSFATRFRFWEAAAEHGIEHIHKMFNEDFDRFNRHKN